MKRLFYQFLITALLIFLTATSCSDNQNPIEARKESETDASQIGIPILGAGAIIISDDFETGLDTNVWFLEHVGNVEWTHTTENGNGYIYSPGQSPYNWENRFTDILTHRDDFNDFLITFDMRMDTESWGKDQRIAYLRCGDVPFPPGYHLFFAVYKPTVTPPQQLHIRKVISGSEQIMLTENVAYPWVVGQWYSFKVQMVGNEIKAKVWPRGDEEPDEWILEAVDPENTFTSGRIGFGDYWGSITDLDNVTVSSLIQNVDLDIKPCSCPNPFNPKGPRGGVLPVAILGAEDFNVTDIDVTTVVLEGVVPIRQSYEDIASPPEGGDECECTIDGPDGYVDLALKFKNSDIEAALGTVTKGDVLQLKITGQLLDGTNFEGVDCIRIVGQEEKRISKFNSTP